MKRALRLGLPLVVLTAVVVGGVLLATQPWSGEDAVQEAAAGTIKHRLCDFVLEAPPAEAPQPGQERLVVGRRVSFESFEPTVLEPAFELRIRGSVRSEVTVDATTGTVSAEHYGAPSHEATLQGTLETLRAEPFDPTTAPWPYTDTSQVPAKRVEFGIFDYRPPDPASGLVAWERVGDTISGAVESFILANCRSVEMVSFDPFSGDELGRMRDVHLDDEAAFETLLDELDVEVLEHFEGLEQ
jgi:hypothetical protein